MTKSIYFVLVFLIFKFSPAFESWKTGHELVRCTKTIYILSNFREIARTKKKWSRYFCKTKMVFAGFLVLGLTDPLSGGACARSSNCGSAGTNVRTYMMYLHRHFLTAIHRNGTYRYMQYVQYRTLSAIALFTWDLHELRRCSSPHFAQRSS